MKTRVFYRFPVRVSLVSPCPKYNTGTEGLKALDGNRVQGVPLRAWGCPFSDHSKTAHELRRSLFPVLSNQDGFPTVYTGFPAELSPSLTRVASAGKVGNPPGRVSYLASILEDTTRGRLHSINETRRRLSASMNTTNPTTAHGSRPKHGKTDHAPRTRYNAPRTRQRSWRA